MPKDFKKLITIRFLFTFASLIQTIILGWQMYELTHDPLFLGLVGLAEAIPALSLALFAGLIVDKGRPLNIFRKILLLSFLSALIIFITQYSPSYFSIKIQVISLFLSSILTGVTRSFAGPTIFSLVPRIVPRDKLPKASAWMTTAIQGARIIGPAMGGLFYGLIGVANTTIIICCLFLLAFIATMLVKFNPPPNKKLESTSIKDNLLIGAKFVYKHKILFPALSLDMVSVFFGGVTALLPIYAAEILKVGPGGLGILRASPAFGALLMGPILAMVNLSHKAGKWLLVSVAGFGFCILAFSISKNYSLSILFLALSGAFDSVSMVVRASIVQLSSPDSMRGRISAVNSMFIGSSNELGEFESGFLAKFFGVVPTAFFGGVACLGTVLVVASYAKKLRRLNLKDLSV